MDIPAPTQDSDKIPDPDPDRIARAVLERYAKLPKNYKPRDGSDDGRREWTPLAGIVAEDTTSPGTMHCISLATGIKCTPTAHLHSAQGTILHDSHAEILAIRAFNRHLLCQLQHLLSPLSPPSTFPILLLEPSSSPLHPFRFRPSLRLHMYTSTCPCGDASMELLMARLPDATPWPSAPPSSPSSLLGRGHFSLLGAVRRKPSRPDAPVAQSKSCTDKLALRQVTGLLSALVALFVAPEGSYLTSLVLPCQEICHVAVERAWGPRGRMKALDGWAAEGRYGFWPFEVLATTVRAEGERSEGDRGCERACVDWGYGREVLINGVLQGRKRGDVRGASSLSRRRMLEMAEEMAGGLGDAHIVAVLSQGNYATVKEATRLSDRAAAKRHAIQHGLPGWMSNPVDRDWNT